MESQDSTNTKQSPESPRSAMDIGNSIDEQKPPLHRSNASRPLSHIQRVQFNSSEDIATHETPDEAELNERWYTNGEYFFFRRDAMNTVRKRERVKGLKDDDGICLRGLEMVDDAVLKVREALVKKAIQTVLEEQRTHTDSNTSNGDQQLSSETHHNDIIAKKYHEISYETIMKAIKIAEENQNEAQEYLGTTRIELSAKESSKERNSQDILNLLGRFFCWKVE